MVRLNLYSDEVRNCKETTTFVKECKKKRTLNLACKKGLLFEKSKEPDKFKEIYKKMEQVKIVKLLEKYPKLEVLMNFKYF